MALKVKGCTVFPILTIVHVLHKYTHTHTQTTLIDVYCDRTPRIPVHVRTLPTSHCDTYSAQSRSVCVDGKRESRVQCVCESDHP